MHRLNRLQNFSKPFPVDVSLGVALRVVNDAVNVRRGQARIAGERVREYLRAFLDVLVNVRLQGPPFRVIDHEGTNFSIPLQKSHNNRLARSTATLCVPLAGVHVSSLAADERLVNFNFAGQLLEAVAMLHGKPDSLLHEPRGFLSDA